MKTNLKFGILQTVYTGDSIVEEIVVTKIDEDGNEYEQKSQIEKHGRIVCCDEKCGRFVQHKEPCFIDVLSENGDVYCDSCGKCLRYSRKREAARREKAKA